MQAFTDLCRQFRNHIYNNLLSLELHCKYLCASFLNLNTSLPIRSNYISLCLSNRTNYRRYVPKSEHQKHSLPRVIAKAIRRQTCDEQSIIDARVNFAFRDDALNLTDGFPLKHLRFSHCQGCSQK